MLPHLADLESAYEPDASRPYEPRELILYALGGTDYWADLALLWLDQGAPIDGLENALRVLEAQPARPQSLRHHARRLRMTF